MKVKELFETEERSVLSVMGKQIDQHFGDFFCSHNRLTSLRGAPTNVSDDFYCTHNFLTSLEGAPHFVGGVFDCNSNELTTLKGAPTSVGCFYCSCNKLTSLEGAPQRIMQAFSCTDNKVTSLKGIHKHIKYVGTYMNLRGNPIKSHVLGLLKIDGLQEVFLDKKKVQDIINKHLKGDRDIFACQEELIEAGYPEYAQL
jgi:hypothetical protein